MRILIRNRQSHLYYSTANEWTSDVQQARTFRSALEAWDYSQIYRLGNTEIVFKKPGDMARSILSNANDQNRTHRLEPQPAF